MMNSVKIGDLKMNILTRTDIAAEWYKANKACTLEQYIRENFISVWGVVEYSFSLHIIGYERISEAA